MSEVHDTLDRACARIWDEIRALLRASATLPAGERAENDRHVEELRRYSQLYREVQRREAYARAGRASARREASVHAVDVFPSSAWRAEEAPEGGSEPGTPGEAAGVRPRVIGTIGGSTS